MKSPLTVGEYLIDRLKAKGVDHLFGIPGDYVLGFYDLLEKSAITPINTCDEQGAGFAADAYARLRGLGAVCVTYCVGGLKVANPVAGAYAEKSPVVVISGAPGMRERENNPLLHHKVRHFETQKRVFEQITVASTLLCDPDTAYDEIDRVLAEAVRHQRPVYIELPRDIVNEYGNARHPSPPLEQGSDPATLHEALEETIALLNRAKNPVILADVEVHRYRLQNEVLELIEQTGIPFTTTILGKSVLGEHHPLYLGLYEGAMGGEEVQRRVESSDCLLMLGAFMTDINLGIYTANLSPANLISATSEGITIHRHHYNGLLFQDYIRGLLAAAGTQISRRSHPLPPSRREPPAPFTPRPETPVSVARLFERIDRFLNDETLVICDVGDALFGAADLEIHRRTEFLGPAYYASMGFSVPAALGAETAKPHLRPLVIVGDGAFQMTGIELSSILKQRLRPIVLVLNNKGYGTERHMLDGSFNDVQEWHYHRLPELIGGGKGWEIRTEKELDTALKEASANSDSFSLLNIHLAPLDRSPALERLAARMATRLSGKA